MHYPQKAYISIVFDEKYPIIAYIILSLKKVQNIFKPRLHVYEPEKSSGTKVWQTEKKIRDRDQVAVFGGRNEKVVDLWKRSMQYQYRRSIPCWTVPVL